MPERTRTETDDFLKLAQERHRTVMELESDQRAKEIADLKFESGEHWDETLLRERQLKRRPTVTVNTLSAMIRSGRNRQRVSRQGIRFRPASMAATPGKAKLYGEVARQIERNSKADMAYDNARHYQRVMGRGYWIVRNRYADDESMEQVVRIDWIDNPHSVFLDPNAKRQDGSDRLWGMVVDDYTLEDFKAAFPEHAADYDMTGFGEHAAPADWMAKDRVRVAEYYWIEQDVRLRIMLDNGEVVAGEELPTRKVRQGRKTVETVVIPEGRTEVRRRHIKVPRVMRSLISASEIFEENEIPCRSIPIIQIDGERRNVPGMGVDYRGQVRDAKEPARANDFMESGILEAIVLARTAPWLVEIQQIAGLEKEWAGQAVNNPAVLRYKAQGSADNPVPPPQRNLAGPDLGAFVAAAQRAENHQRQTLGEPDVFQEETKREQSGRAIQARRALQEVGTSHYGLNEAAGIVRTGEILLEMIPRIYDAPRLMRITGDRGQDDRNVVLYSGQDRRMDAETMAQRAGGAELFDPSDGRYEVAVNAATNALTDRIEATETITEAIRQHPPLAPIALPILFQNSDWAGSEQLVEALTKDKQVPPEIMERMQALDKFAATASKALDEAKAENDRLRKKLEDKDADRETKREIAMAQQATQRFREAASNATTLAVEEMRQLGENMRADMTALEARLRKLMDSSLKQSEGREERQTKLAQTQLAGDSALQQAAMKQPPGGEPQGVG